MFWEIAYWIGYVIILFTTVGSVCMILLENRNPLKSIAWILVFLFLPIVGVLCYFLFGKKFRKKRVISRRSLRRAELYEATCHRKATSIPADVPQRSIAVLAEGNSDAPFFEKNAVEIFTEASLLYEKMFDDIKNAQHHINLEYYIFAPDKIGQRMMEALKEKAREGVEVRVIIDDVGSWNFRKKHEEELREAGVEVERYLPVHLSLFSSRVNYRNHRKILVIDGKIGYTGGMNIADRYIDGVKWGVWRDTHCRYEGPVVLGLQNVFFEDWYFVRQVLISDEFYYPVPKPCGEVNVQTVVSGPDMEWEAIMQIFAKSFSMANKRVFIETPYFLPPESLVTALQSAALSGVDVRLILPRKSDAVLTLWSTFSYISEMLKSGVKVYFYQPGFIHSKVAIVDDAVSFVGSANMDFRSFEQNFELNTIVYDEKTTSQLIEMFENDLANSEQVSEVEWEKRSNLNKIMESIARLCSPLL